MTGKLLPQQVLKRFTGTGLNRDLLLRWAKQGLVKTHRMDGGHGGNDTHLYLEPELPRIAALVWGHDLGLTPDLSLRLASLVDPSLLRAEPDALLKRFRQLFQAIQDIPSLMLGGQGTDDLEQIATMGSRLVPSECCSIFLVDGPTGRLDAGVRLKLVAQSAGPFNPVAIELNGKSTGLTAALAKGGALVTAHGVTLQKHRNLVGGPPKHLPSQKTCSVMLVPVFDRHRRPRAYLKFENKKSGDRMLEDAFYDPFDQAVAHVLASQAMIVLEDQAIRNATTDLMRQGDQLKLSEYLSRLLHHAIQLVGGDYGDVFWRGDDDRFVVLSQHGDSTIKKGTEPPSPSVARTVADSQEPKLISDVTAVSFYAKCRPTVFSEVTVPVMRGSRCVAVLNVESDRRGAFDRHDVSTLQYLADHAIPEVESVYRRDEMYKSLEMILGAMEKQRYENVLQLILKGLKYSGFDRARVFEYEQKMKRFVCAGSVGVDEPDGQYAKIPIPVTDQYARLTVEDSKRSPVVVQIRRPVSNTLDPIGKQLGKKPGLPWVIYPLVRNKALLGYIAADNHVTSEPFTPTLLGNLPLFGLLAARTMLNKRKGGKHID